MQPLLISNIIELVSESDSESSNDRGWSLTAAVGLVYIGLAVTGGAYQHKANRMTTMVRGALVNAIYSQTLDLSITNLDESAAVTLMSSDVDRICEAILSIHNMWSSPVDCISILVFAAIYWRSSIGTIVHNRHCDNRSFLDLKVHRQSSNGLDGTHPKQNRYYSKGFELNERHKISWHQLKHLQHRL